jgi:hypothetical protein
MRSINGLRKEVRAHRISGQDVRMHKESKRSFLIDIYDEVWDEGSLILSLNIKKSA